MTGLDCVKAPRRFVLLLAGLGLLGVAVAQEIGNSYPFAGGKIDTLDLATKQITVVTPKGPRLFFVTNSTYLIAGGVQTTLDKLKVGDPVKLNYFTNTSAQAIIRRLKVTPPEPSAAP